MVHMVHITTFSVNYFYIQGYICIRMRESLSSVVDEKLIDLAKI